MERVLYNTILGAKALEPDGSSFYYSDYQPNGNKFYHPDKWPCCSGTLPQVLADYHISIYFRSPDGVYVNLYTPSRLKWKHETASCTLTQRTAYPDDGRITFDFSASHPVQQTIYLRIPKWAGTGTKLSVNGESQSGIQAGQFFAVTRKWKSGDSIQIELPMLPRLEAVDVEHPDLQTLCPIRVIEKSK